MTGANSFLAEVSPRDLLRSFFFWQSQKQFVLVIVASLVMLYALRNYTYDYAHGWVILTLIVQGIGVWGIVLAMNAIARVEIETAIVTQIELRGSEQLRSLQSHQTGRIDLDQLEQDILPVYLSYETPAMIRLFQHICREA